MFNRDSDFAKTLIEVFKQLEKKYNKRFIVTSGNAKLVEDSLLPQMIVQDQKSGEIVA